MTRWPFALLLMLSVASLNAPGALGTTSFKTNSENNNNNNNINNNNSNNNNKQNYIGYKKTILTVGYLTAIKGELKDRQGLAISGALTLALEEINNDTGLLPNVTLALRWNDTRGDTVLATRALTEMICDGIATFFGPEGPCHVEAIVSQSRNIPMISYVSNLILLYLFIFLLSILLVYI